MIKSIITAVFLILAFISNGQKLISLDSLGCNGGKLVKICEKVSDTFKPAGDDKPTYLNFGGKYPDHKFTVVIFAKDYPNFPYSPMEYLKDKNVCITGTITYYKERPQIVASKAEQIEVK
jgi:hypothetical protein